MIKKKIIKKINEKKLGISIEEFTNLCLFDKNGYYRKINPIGQSGDFITAPEISQLFGEIIGIFIYSIWKNKFKNTINLIELGPGNGTLMMDLLRITKKLENFHEYIKIHLIDKNKYLIKQQKKQIIKNNLNKINFKWHNTFPNIKKNPSIILANEFFDCFPVRQFKKKNNQWNEKIINYKKNEDRFFYDYLIVSEKEILKKLLINKKEIFEISIERENYFSKICQYLAKSSGIFIIIDYGYFNFPENYTLQTVFNQKKSNLFDNIGKQDISSLVDFKKLIEIAEKNNLRVEIFCTQREFLLKNGITERKKIIVKNASKKQKINIENGFSRLIDEKDMGLNMKFLILSSKN